MSKKQLYITGLSVFLLVLFISVAIWYWKGKEQMIAVEDNQSENLQAVDQSNTNFVVDVDPDVNHWQTKETEFFTIKFPKEWYWLESDREKTGYWSRIITNNKNFDINKYAEIGLSMGTDYVFTNDTEIILPFGASATSNIGTPQQSMDSSLQWTKKQQASAMCGYLSNINDNPIVARCSYIDKNDQKVQAYFIVNKMNKISFYVRTTKNNLVQKSILDEIAENMIVKESF